MEEDWLWLESKTDVPAIAMATSILEADSSVVGVFLRSVVQFGVETSVPGYVQNCVVLMLCGC